MPQEPADIEPRPTISELQAVPGWDAFARDHRDRLRNYTGKKGRAAVSWEIIGAFLWRLRKRHATMCGDAQELARVVAERDELRQQLDKIRRAMP